MGLYSFKERFKPMILSGEKTHTIRNVRKYPDKPGNDLFLYTGLRTKKAKRIMVVECVKIEEIEIVETVRIGIDNGVINGSSAAVSIDGQLLTLDEQEQLAHRDGFADFAEMIKFWQEPKNRLPFTGHIIHWKLKEKQNVYGQTERPRSSKQRTHLGTSLARGRKGSLAGQ